MVSTCGRWTVGLGDWRSFPTIVSESAVLLFYLELVLTQ